jgi:alkaline phosphatase D
MIDRRRFLATLGALAVSPAFPQSGSYPFARGVASGYPLASSVVLWTRLLGASSPVSVDWEIAEDDSLRRIVARGNAVAEPAWAHSIHVEPQGLQPDRWYWYRFTAGDAQSPIGRTRTAPPAGAQVARLRFGFASCQHYEQGYFSAYRHIAADQPDLALHVGDYIYESSWGRDHVRKHNIPEPMTLDDYRMRYAQYKSDPDLQSAHAACPWLATWDDHDVENDYADDRSENNDPREWFLARRAAAYKAWYEHMPVPREMVPLGPYARIYTRSSFGNLANFFVLDDRQFRSHQACPRPGRGGSNTVDVAECTDLADPKRTMLGAAQEQWLEAQLGASRARWNFIVQQTAMAQFDQKPGPGRSAWTDGWDGYPLARRKLLDFISSRKVSNPVVLGGDVHSFNVNHLKLDFDDPASPTVASEFVGTSITSQAWSQERLAPLLVDNPHMTFSDGRYRGYARFDLARERLGVDLRAMESVQKREAACNTLANFIVEDGKPGAVRNST